MRDLANRVRSLLRPELAALHPYHVADARGLVKLDAMENPYSWPEGMTEQWLDRLRQAAVNRYPDPSATELRSALRATAGVPDGAEILLGNGSDELIQIILMAVAGGDAVVLAPEPTFVMYRQLAVSLGLRFAGVPLRNDDFSLDMEAMRVAIRQHQPAVIFLAYPNNPTGNLFREEDVTEVLAIAPGLVVIDEAYAPFAGTSFLPRLLDHESLLVMRTLSKMGLAGLRLGYLVGAPEWIVEFDKLRLPYNINVLTQISAEYALSRSDVFDDQVKRLLGQRDYVSRQLNELPGVHAYPSRANFILFEMSLDAGRVFETLKARGILVKSFHSLLGPLHRCLRVTVGTPEENQLFLEQLSKILGR